MARRVDKRSGLIRFGAIWTILAAVGVVRGQVPVLGACPSNVAVKEDIDLQQYTGRWYEYSKYPFIFEFNGKCIIATYSALSNGDIRVVNSQRDKTTSAEKSISGNAVVAAPGKLVVSFDNIPNFGGGSNYWVLDTDYTNFAVVYSCTDIFGIFHTKVVWILTRERKPSSDVIQKAQQVITSQQLPLSPLTLTDQNNCPVLP